MNRPRAPILAWCLFDFANSAYTTVIVTTVFSVYFVRTVAGAGAGGLRGETLWSLSNSLSLIIAALLSPVLGALADARAMKRPLMIASSLACIAATALLATVGSGQIVRAIVLFVIANVGFEIGYVFYNGFLPEIAPEHQVGRISGFGWAAGYIGGLVALACSLVPLSLMMPADPPPGAAEHAARITFLLVAAHFFVFAIPAFLVLKDRSAARPAPGDLLEPIRQVFRTLRSARRHKDAFTFILASLIYNDGLVTIFTFAGIYMSDVLGFSTSEIVMVILVLNVPSALGSALFGPVADRIGAKRAILATLLVLTVSVALMAATAPGHGASAAEISRARHWFIAVAMLTGLAIGANQSVSRGFMSQLIPTGHQAEFFGFFIFSGKLASVLAPLTYAAVVQTTSDSRLAILSVVIFLVAGGALLLRVDEAAGIAHAKATS